jgi:hypothetical protein
VGAAPSTLGTRFCGANYSRGRENLGISPGTPQRVPGFRHKPAAVRWLMPKILFFIPEPLPII